LGHHDPLKRVREHAGSGRVLRWRLGGAARKVAPITIDLLREMVDTCPPTPAGQRDHALLVVGLAAALRRSEIAALRCDDIERPDVGSGRIAKPAVSAEA
jgi:integrase